jgi:hypothetical protein
MSVEKQSLPFTVPIRDGILVEKKSLSYIVPIRDDMSVEKNAGYGLFISYSQQIGYDFGPYEVGANYTSQ